MAKRLDGKVAIVTGGSRGIGRAIAKLYAQEGAKVLLTYMGDREAANTVVDEIRDCGGEAVATQGDVSLGDDTNRIAKETIERYGRIDILCANAGIFPHVTLSEMTETDWNHVIAVNLSGVFHMVKACLPQLQSQRYGRVVIVSSVTGPKTGVPGLAHYGASKGGVMGFINSACLELAKFNVTCNAVEPGIVLTESLKQEVEEAKLQQVIEEIPLGAVPEPIDIAQAALFLATDEARLITGQSITIDGGLMRPELSLRLIDRD